MTLKRIIRSCSTSEARRRSKPSRICTICSWIGWTNRVSSNHLVGGAKRPPSVFGHGTGGGFYFIRRPNVTTKMTTKQRSALKAEIKRLRAKAKKYRDEDMGPYAQLFEANANKI